MRLDLRAGSTLSVTNIEGAASAYLTLLLDNERTFSAVLRDVLPKDQVPLPVGTFDATEMTALTQARDGRLCDGRGIQLFDETAPPGELFVTKVDRDCTVFIIAPVSPDYVEKGGGSRFAARVQPPASSPSDIQLPRPLGAIKDEFRVARGTAQAYEVKKGQYVQIIDVEGQQCSDFMALRASALNKGVERSIDSTVSRTMSRSAYPLPGLHDKFFDQDIKPLLAVRQDTVGRHDTFALACTARGYEERGFPGHINCSDNISDAFEPYGIQRRTAWPAINFFFNSWINPEHGNLASDEAWSRPGDYVAMEALTDLVCVSTACPDDVDPINGWNPTDIHVRIYEDTSTISHAVSWRAQPEDSAKMTRHSAFHPRTSKLTSHYTVARDLWAPSHFDATGGGWGILGLQKRSDLTGYVRASEI